MAKRLFGVLIVLGLAVGCGSPESGQEQASEPSQVEPQEQAAPTEKAPVKKAPQKKVVTLPEYEIFDDSVDSTGMRLVFVGTADGFSPAQQRAIVADILEPEKGKNRWVRVFVRPNSERLVTQRGDCLESLNATSILPCNYSR